jgi:hypothetical protein
MQFLIHGVAAPEIAAALVAHEHKTHLISELELPPEATGEQILAAASQRQWDIFTTDRALAQAPFAGGKKFTRCIVYFQDGTTDPAAVVERLFERYSRLTPGRLYTITGSRVKIRQLPTSKNAE